jgi:hypothetical protein
MGTGQRAVVIERRSVHDQSNRRDDGQHFIEARSVAPTSRNKLKSVPAMEKQTGDLTMFRYELVHGDDAEFITYQRQLGDGSWQTLSRWMIPGTDCLD